jgi:short subunit fatty acids transporter
LVFSAAYLIPVSLSAWYFGLRAVVLMCIASGVASWLMDIGHPYSQAMFQFWNAFASFAICVVTGLLVHRLKHTLEERKRVNNDLQKALEELERSTEEIRKLQSGLQVVCAWTNRIKVGDQWMTPDEFLSTQLHLNLTHGMSPEAYRELEQEIERKAHAEAPQSSDR